MIDLHQVRERFHGKVFDPATPGYDAVREPANTRFRDVRPRLVFKCRSVSDVVLAIRYARDAGIHIVPRSGGHCFEGRSSTDGIVLDVAELDGVNVDGDWTARIGAGARLARIYAALHEHERTLPAGCGPTVGIAGHALGGGIGLLGRKYGLTCDRLVGAQVVLADGRVVDCDRDREPDLFWALRGAGGGQFGVVTALVFATVSEPTARRFAVRWPQSRIADVIEAWQHWAPGAPDEFTANLAIVAEPGRPAEPVLYGASLLPEAPTRDLLDAFCAVVGSSPAVEIGDELVYHRLKATLAELDPHHEPDAGLRIRSELFAKPMQPRTIRELVAALLDESSTDRRRLAFTAMGGAYNRVPASATAFAHRGERYLVEHQAAVTSAWIDKSWAIAHTDGSGRVYPNFPDPTLDDWKAAYHAGNHGRLAAVKRTYDPDRLFTFPQSVLSAMEDSEMTELQPFLWFDHEAEEAAKHYTSIVDGGKITRVTENGSAGPGAPGTVQEVDFELAGLKFTALNAGPHDPFNVSMSIMIHCDTQEEVDRYWDRLTEDGEPGPCGWLKDKFGVSWQIFPKRYFELRNGPDPVKSQAVVTAMLNMGKIESAGLQTAYDNA